MSDEKINFSKKVANVIANVKAPKGQINKFGNYKYRSCEDILEAVKPCLDGLVLTINDDVKFFEGRFYIKATATLSDGVNEISASAFARETLSKKGMDEAQVTGSASSYARKYALNGLFCIDDSKVEPTQEVDSQDNRNNQKRNYKKEKEIKNRLLAKFNEKTQDMAPPQKMQWFKEVFSFDSFKTFDQMNEQQLLEQEAKLDGK